MSEVDGRFVKRELWTNLDQGSIMSKTITTNSTTGMIIIATLAIISTVGTSHLWSLLLFGYHQLRANGRPSDGLFRQQQAILRTLPPPSSLMAESVKLWWLWRRINDRVLSRSLIQFLLATSCTIGFIVASISTSFVVNTSDLEVLIQIPSCHYLNETLPLEVRCDSATSLLSVSVPYAEECYSRQSIPSARCKAYVNPKISFTTERVHCPFNETMCVANRPGDLPAIALDSGLLDVSTSYGLNLPKADSVSYRKRKTCSVLPLAGHTEIVNTSDIPPSIVGRDPYPGEGEMLLYYGERFSTVAPLKYTKGGNVFRRDWERQGKHQSIVSLESMHRDDADLILLFLTASVTYTKPVDDPWFSAHKESIVYDPTIAADSTVHRPDSPVTALGYTVQHQFCFRTASGLSCSKLDALPLSRTLAEWEKASPLQQFVLQLLLRVSETTDMQDASKLRISKKLRYGGGIFVDIPSDQWVDEVQGIESSVWAASQVSLADYAIGYGVRNPDLANWVLEPTSTSGKELCSRQKMRKQGGFFNINVFGMVFVIAVSAIFAILDVTIMKFLIFLDGFRAMFRPRIDRWTQDGVLQLQRRAYEADGQDTWSNLKHEIPLTGHKKRLKEFPLQASLNTHISTSSPPPIRPQPSPAPTQPPLGQPQHGPSWSPQAATTQQTPTTSKTAQPQTAQLSPTTSPPPNLTQHISPQARTHPIPSSPGPANPILSSSATTSTTNP